MNLLTFISAGTVPECRVWRYFSQKIKSSVTADPSAAPSSPLSSPVKSKNALNAARNDAGGKDDVLLYRSAVDNN
jgi:hypothetical protein